MEQECINCRNYLNGICHLFDEKVEEYSICYYFKEENYSKI